MTNSVNENSINNLVEKLRHRLKNFAIVAPSGERLGEVQDFILDANRQLKLVVKAANNSEEQLFLLISKLIVKIEPADKTILVNINNQALFLGLPKYVKPEAFSDEINPIIANQSVSEGINQFGDRQNYTSSVSTGEDVLNTPLFEQKMEQNNINIAHNTEDRGLGEEIIRLLGERVVVERKKRKVGEVIVRKQIETRMVQVPVRYEKLIVEQVGAEPKQLAEIILGEVSNNDSMPETVTTTKTDSQDVSLNAIIEDINTTVDAGLTVRGKFNSPKIASLLLNAIAIERTHGCKQVRVEIVVDNEERKKTYQEWFNRTSLKD